MPGYYSDSFVGFCVRRFTSSKLSNFSTQYTNFSECWNSFHGFSEAAEFGRLTKIYGTKFFGTASSIKIVIYLVASIFFRENSSRFVLFGQTFLSYLLPCIPCNFSPKGSTNYRYSGLIYLYFFIIARLLYVE